MPVTISSRTPEGEPNYCLVCGTRLRIEPSSPCGDAPCPSCGTLLWFIQTSAGPRFHDAEATAAARERIGRMLFGGFGIPQGKAADAATLSFIEDLGADSLDIVELIMELEEEFEVTVPDDVAERIKTVGDAIDYVLRHARRPSDAPG